MRLSDEEKKELLEDGKDLKRRENFRIGSHPQGPLTFEAYIAALDDLSALRVSPLPRRSVPYPNPKL